MTDLLIRAVMPIAMFTLMFAMGLTLTAADFKRVMLFPKAICIGLVIQLGVMPFIGLGLAYAFELPVMIAVGLVAVGGVSRRNSVQLPEEYGCRTGQCGGYGRHGAAGDRYYVLLQLVAKKTAAAR